MPCAHDAGQLSHRPGRHRRRAPRGLRFLLGAALLVLAAAVPAQTAAIGPLPECRIADILTVPRGYDDWRETLVDWLLRVEEDYVPPDLVPVSEAGIAGPGLIRAVAVDDLRALAEAAAANGTPIEVNSPYRSYQEQVASFNGWVAIDGYEIATTYSHRPGHSGHQLGIVIDFQALGGPSALNGDWATTPTGGWMKENAWKFGWLMAYPLDPDWQVGDDLWSDRTCFTYEPWHYQYLGRELAAAVHESGLTIREYQWQHFTMVDVETGLPLPTPTPTPSPTPSPTPTPTATPSPTASPVPSATPAAPPETPGTWLGLEPPVVAALGLGGLTLLATVAAVSLRRRSGRDRR